MEKQQLRELGFSEGESEVYVALLKHGKTSVMQLAKLTGRHRTHIYDTIEKLKEKGLTDIIVEPAHQDYLVMLGGWKQFGSQVYGVAPGTMGWSDIEHSYFGRNAPPYFLYGDAAPNPQDWSMWSQTKLE